MKDKHISQHVTMTAETILMKESAIKVLQMSIGKLLFLCKQTISNVNFGFVIFFNSVQKQCLFHIDKMHQVFEYTP